MIDRKHTVVGLIPAAGQATRFGSLPFSKELFPIIDPSSGESCKPKPVCEFLLENMRGSGIQRAYMVIRNGKWDIPSYLGDGSRFGMSLGYLLLGLPYGVPYTLDQAYEHVRSSIVALGYPDVIFRAPDAFRACLSLQHDTSADIVLGAFPADDPPGVDMVDFRDDGEVNRIEIKPKETKLVHAWAIAVWAPSFTEYLHRSLTTLGEAAAPIREVQIGGIINQAMNSGLRVRALVVSNDPFIDIGTPAGLARLYAKNGAKNLSVS